MKQCQLHGGTGGGPKAWPCWRTKSATVQLLAIQLIVHLYPTGWSREPAGWQRVPQGRRGCCCRCPGRYGMVWAVATASSRRPCGATGRPRLARFQARGSHSMRRPEAKRDFQLCPALPDLPRAWLQGLPSQREGAAGGALARPPPAMASCCPSPDARARPVISDPGRTHGGALQPRRQSWPHPRTVRRQPGRCRARSSLEWSLR